MDGGGHPTLVGVGLLGDVLEGLGGGGPGGQLEEDAGLPLDWFLKHFNVGFEKGLLTLNVSDYVQLGSTMGRRSLK